MENNKEFRSAGKPQVSRRGKNGVSVIQACWGIKSMPLNLDMKGRKQDLALRRTPRDQVLIESFVPKQFQIATRLPETPQGGEHLHPRRAFVAGVVDGIGALPTLDQQLFMISTRQSPWRDRCRDGASNFDFTTTNTAGDWIKGKNNITLRFGKSQGRFFIVQQDALVFDRTSNKPLGH